MVAAATAIENVRFKVKVSFINELFFLVKNSAYLSFRTEVDLL